MASASRTAVTAALAGNLALVALKATAAATTGSSAMFAETLHSVADTGNQALMLLGLRLAVRPPDERHPFGHGRDVFFWAFVVSGLIFTVGGVFSLWEGAAAFRHPRQPETFAWAYGVLGGAFVFESASFSVALRALLRDKGDQPILDYLRDARDPAVDAVAGLQTMHLGPISLLIALEIRFRPNLRADDVAAAVTRLERAIRAGLRATPGRHVVLIEPVTERAAAPGAAA